MLLEQAQQLKSTLTEWRRDFHRHPELGFREQRTASRIAQIIGGFGFRVRSGVGRTGVVAELGRGSPIVAIRADMDALPILESSGAPYASQVPGVMHACGHDAHMTIALGAARLLSKAGFPGSLRFLFQPSEEAADDEGISGAPRMIADGAMDSVNAILALHVDPDLPAGDIAVKAGVDSGGVDTFYASVLGKGGHGAKPHEVIDPIYLSGLVILALHGIVSRRLHPFDPAVISIGSIHGGNADNVIPDRVDLNGTIRFLDPSVQSTLHAEIEKALAVARNLGGDYQLKLEIGYPPMVNDARIADLIRRTGEKLLGAAHIQVPQHSMGAEDFAYLAQEAPGAMFRLGCARSGQVHKLHSSAFDLDENCLPVGAAMLAQAALELLTNPRQILEEDVA